MESGGGADMVGLALTGSAEACMAYAASPADLGVARYAWRS